VDERALLPLLLALLASPPRFLPPTLWALPLPLALPLPFDRALAFGLGFGSAGTIAPRSLEDMMAIVEAMAAFDSATNRSSAAEPGAHPWPP